MRILKRLLLVLLGFLLLLETVPRFVTLPGLEMDELRPSYVASTEGRAFEPHPYLIFTPIPGWERNDDALQRSHDEHGFRGKGVPRAKPEGVTRIACIGGSSTYGTGPTSDDKAWPARLGAILNERRPERPIDVINGGAPSWNSFECLGNLAFRVVPFAPDVVLIYLSTNDAEAALWPSPTTDNRHYRLGWKHTIPSPLEASLERSITYLVWRKYLTNHLEESRRLDRYAKIVPDGAIGEALMKYEVPPELAEPGAQGFENFQRNLVSIVAVARAHGAVPVLLTQALWSPDPDSHHLFHGKERIAAQKRMTDIVRAVANERSVPLIEMRDALESLAAGQITEGGKQTVFTNNVHLTDEGAEVFAQRLADELERVGVL